jgi:hypothetical protein
MDQRSWITTVLLNLALFAVGVLHQPALASGITSTWSGASASVVFDTQTRSQQGATANAAAGGSYTINYEGSPAINPPMYFQSTVSGNVAASAGGNAAQLLQVTAASNAPDPGTLGYSNTTGSASATASWTNDAAIVTAPAGSNLPDAIRLNFTLTFSAPIGAGGPYATLTASYNGTQLGYYASDGNDPALGVHSNATNAGAVDSHTVTNSPGSNVPVAITDTFHIDLALNQSGVSAPFSLTLALSPFVGLVSNSNVDYSGLSGNIVLTGVTLADGTPLSALGDSVSFESGLGVPGVVPEPASLLVWGVIAAAASAMAVQRSRAHGQRAE